VFKGLLSLILVIGALLLSADSKELQASDTLDRCIETMGGLQRLQSARIVTYQADGHTFFRSISTVDSEPGVYSYESKEVILDLQRQLIHEQIRSQWTESETMQRQASPSRG
jgi:hypothetical protein